MKNKNYGGMGNMNGMMKQVQQMQKQMEKMQEELELREIDTTSGGGAVKVTVNGKKEILKLEIQPDAVDVEDMEMLQDLIMVAINDALKQADEMMSREMGKLTGGLNIPGLF